MKSSMRLGGLVIALSLVVSVLITAQTKNLRVAFVNAVDASGAPVLTLTAADFEVHEGDAKKPATYAGLIGASPMRIMLFIDSSESEASYAGQMRDSLTAFVAGIPDKHEIGLVTMGRQVRVRLQPTADRAKIKSAINSMGADGGGIMFFDTFREVETRFMKKEGVRWPIYAMFVTDGNEASSPMPNDEFTKLATDMLGRGTTIHADVVQKLGPSPVTDIVSRFTKNSGGIFQETNSPIQLPDRMKEMAVRIASDYEKVQNHYQIEYSADPKFNGNMDVVVLKPGVKGVVSIRRSGS